MREVGVGFEEGGVSKHVFMEGRGGSKGREGKGRWGDEMGEMVG